MPSETTHCSYEYVGDAFAVSRVAAEPPSIPLHSARQLVEVLARLEESGQAAGEICTYVVDQAHRLRVAVRRSEHVVCAGGEAVLAAGEIRFSSEGELRVDEVTNQSTGFCPDASCWEAVKAALDVLGLEHPPGFTQTFVFRRCEHCGERNIVKEEWFVCGLCAADVPADYNF